MSSFIKLRHISFAYDCHVNPLFSDLSLSFHEGWTALSGVNGCGKSTLFRLIYGDLSPQIGHIEVRGRICLIPQDTEVPPKGLEGFSADYSRKALQLRDALGLDVEMFTRWHTLSIGERKKIQIAVALISKPDILLVDEPTNHVDETAKKQILFELKHFYGVGLLISHDRLLLNNLCENIVFMEDGRCSLFHSSYDNAKRELLQIQQNQSRRRDLIKNELKDLKRSAQRQAEKVNEGKKKLSKKGLHKSDHDAREKINRAKLFGADLADSRKKRVIEQKEQRVRGELSQIQVKKQYNLGVFFGEITQRKRLFLPAELWTLPFLSIHCPELLIEPGEHIAITGPNGVGKTSFLRLLIERFGSLPLSLAKQELSQNEKKELGLQFSEMDSETKGRIYTLISCFGSDPKLLTSNGLPSPGLWQKLIIAQAIVKGLPFLFLDEPTNHIDIAALEVLEAALSLYQGTLIVISHDRAFIDRVCTRELVLNKNEIEVTINIKNIEKDL